MCRAHLLDKEINALKEAFKKAFTDANILHELTINHTQYTHFTGTLQKHSSLTFTHVQTLTSKQHFPQAILTDGRNLDSLEHWV